MLKGDEDMREGTGGQMDDDGCAGGVDGGCWG